MPFIGAVLLRVTVAMAGAVCGQTLPVVVKAQTISRSAWPLFLSLSFFSAAYCTALTDRVERRERGGGEINECEEKVD